jgi:hypothetical protein
MKQINGHRAPALARIGSRGGKKVGRFSLDALCTLLADRHTPHGVSMPPSPPPHSGSSSAIIPNSMAAIWSRHRERTPKFAPPKNQWRNLIQEIQALADLLQSVWRSDD